MANLVFPPDQLFLITYDQGLEDLGDPSIFNIPLALVQGVQKMVDLVTPWIGVKALYNRSYSVHFIPITLDQEIEEGEQELLCFVAHNSKRILWMVEQFGNLDSRTPKEANNERK